MKDWWLATAVYAFPRSSGWNGSSASSFTAVRNFTINHDGSVDVEKRHQPAFFGYLECH